MMRFLLFVVSITLLSSCANRFSVQKRKYTKGYYYASSSKSNSKKADKEVKEKIILASEEVPMEEVAVTSFKEETRVRLAENRISEEKTITTSEKKRSLEAFQEKTQGAIQLENKSSYKANSSRSSSPFLFELLSGGSGLYAVFGLVSALISLLIALYYIFIIFSAVSGGSAGAGLFGVLVIVGVVLLAAVIIGVLLVNSD